MASKNIQFTVDNTDYWIADYNEGNNSYSATLNQEEGEVFDDTTLRYANCIDAILEKEPSGNPHGVEPK